MKGEDYLKYINLKTFLVISLVLLLNIYPVTTYAGRQQELEDGRNTANEILNVRTTTRNTTPQNTPTRTTINTYTGNTLPNAGNFIEAGKNAGNNLNTANVVSKMDESIGSGLVSILALLYKIGALVAVCIFAFMGVQFVIASPQQKAQLKASLFPYFIGLLLFVAGVPIATAIINIFLQLL